MQIKTFYGEKENNDWEKAFSAPSFTTSSFYGMLSHHRRTSSRNKFTYLSFQNFKYFIKFIFIVRTRRETSMRGKEEFDLKTEVDWYLHAIVTAFFFLFFALFWWDSLNYPMKWIGKCVSLDFFYFGTFWTFFDVMLGYFSVD